MRRVLAAFAVAALAACAKPAATVAPTSSASATSGGPVGYVRMEELVKRHPLYGQLAEYDASIDALNLTATIPAAAASGPELARGEKQLNVELDDARKRTEKILHEKQDEYAKRESAAISAALAGGSVPGRSTTQIATQMNATAKNQYASAARAAQNDFNAYRAALVLQDRSAIDAATRALQARAERTYNAKRDELQSKESQLALDLAGKDAGERLSVKTRLSNLSLDDAAREESKAQLAAIERREADAIGAMRNKDQATLGALQTQLRAGVESDARKAASDIQTRSIAKLKARETTVRAQFAAPSGPVIAQTQGGPAVNPNLPPNLRAKITALHSDYQKKFETDAKSTIDDFNRTKSDLTRRFEALHGIDARAQDGARKQIASLQKKRDDLYGQIIAQIDREVRVVAHNRGISVVLNSIVGSASGVDLTADAQKDIESLHE